ncbi:alpha/beta hydrolase family protein [Ferrovibrio sp.]|jgi:fermentation-respiration switch protein FrsA (DUF1100 family)|uniref:alpha/beta hydrolase family protein n=1 Tax=Ferrovibrio sp. TaxID=1917215 RepID=UPI0035B0C9EC
MRRLFISLLTGLLLLPSGGWGAESIINQQVRITSRDGTSLAGTLTLPAGAKEKLPALVLLQGSGPTDRDGNQPPAMRTDLLRQVAEGLAEKGVATLRYDKRGLPANAASVPGDPAQYPEYFDWHRFVDDAYAAYAFLRAQPAVDPGKAGLFGHSEGGLIALDLASRLVDGEKPQVLILAATPGRPMDVIIREQLSFQLSKQVKPSERRLFLAENERAAKNIRATGQVPAKLPAALGGVYPSYSGRYWQALMQIDPVALAQRYRGPVMLLQGDADIQVSAERDALVLDGALQKREPDDHALVILPRTSHNLKPLQSDKDPGLEGEVDPGVISRISTWLLARLGP